MSSSRPTARGTVAVETTTKFSRLACVHERGQLSNMAKSAVRALDVLELLAAAAEPLRAIDIARALQLSPSSTDQILKSMVDSAYLGFDAGTKRYDLPARLMRLGAALSAAYFDPGSIDRLTQAVQRASGGTVILAAPQAAFMQVIDICEPPPAQAVTAPVCTAPVCTAPTPNHVLKGLHTPFFGSCTGAAWLSTQSDATIRRIMQKSRRELGAAADDVESVLAILHRVASQGYAVGGLMADDGIWSVAVPLPPAANGTVLVLVVAAPREKIEGNHLDIVAQMKHYIRRYLGSGANAG